MTNQVWPIYGRYYLGNINVTLIHVVYGTREDAVSILPVLRKRDEQLSLYVGERPLDSSVGTELLNQ